MSERFRRVLHEVRCLTEEPEQLVPDLKAEILFWAHQFAEHALFMHLMLVQSDLKERAAKLKGSWDEFQKVAATKDPDSLLRDVYAQCDILRAFKVEVTERQLRGEWVGWIPVGMVQHFREELDYFVLAVSNEMTARQAVEKWLEFAAEHAQHTAHMIDPYQDKQVGDAAKFARRFWGLKHSVEDQVDAKLLDVSVEMEGRFEQWIRSEGVGTRKVRSTMPPELVAHILREGEKFRAVLQRIDAPEKPDGR
jgi:hypothetical protein